MSDIFISYAGDDRAVATQIAEGLRKSGQQVIAMVDYVAPDRRPLEQFLQNVKISDMEVERITFRSGSVPPTEHGNPNA